MNSGSFGSSGKLPSLFSREDVSRPDSRAWLVAYTDGGSRGNPGPSGYGVLLQDGGARVVAELSEFIGIGTNNVAEYSGMLAALEYALEHGYVRLRVISDSELMVKQISGKYRVQSPDLRPLFEEARRRIAKLEAFQIEHVLRGKNRRADELANAAMDHGMRRASPRAATNSAAGARGLASLPEAPSAPAPVRPLRGMVKGGKISLLEGSLPEGTIVVVMPERALHERAATPKKP